MASTSCPRPPAFGDPRTLNPFDDIADGYAKHRPPVHAEILRRAIVAPVGCALDVGCGSGISTLALKEFAQERIGIEPAAAMVDAARAVDPGARFLVGPAESIPLPDASLDLITAAGSLNYVDLDRFFPEALRLLKPSGKLLVYDFSTGHRTDHNWLAQFIERYPWAPHEARHLDPQILATAAQGFSLVRPEQFAVRLTLTRDFYLAYMMTETNVAYAIRQGAHPDDIRSWCHQTLWPDSQAQVDFPAYYALFQPSTNSE